MEITGLSPSSVELWRQCPRKFYEEKVRGRSGGTGEAALMGTLVHSVLEHLMCQPPEQRTLVTARRLMSEVGDEFFAGDAWTAFAAEVETDARDVRRRAWASVCGYFQIEDPASIEVLATERYFTTVIDGVPVRGIVDRLEKDWFEDVVVTDYKTGKVPAPWFRDPKIRQLNFYAAMVEAIDGRRPTEGRLLFTSFGECIETTITGESVGKTMEVVSEAWEGLQSAQLSGVWEAQPGPLCGWCPFVVECEVGLAEVRSRRAAGKLKQSAPAWDLAVSDEEG